MNKFQQTMEDLWQKFATSVVSVYHKFVLPGIKALEAEDAPVVEELALDIGKFIEEQLAAGAKLDAAFGHSVMDYAMGRAKDKAPGLAIGAVMTLTGSMLHAAAPGAVPDTTNQG